MQLSVKPIAFVRHTGIPFLRENSKLVGQFVFTLFFVGIGIWFVRHEQVELHQVRQTLATARWEWLTAGVLLSFFYILLQGLMYVSSFAATSSHISVGDAVLLFLKRNFVSVFLPAGGVSSLAFFTSPIRNKGVSSAQIHFASSIYAFVGILSVIVVAVPAFLLALVRGGVGALEWVALGAALMLIIVCYFLYQSIGSQGFLYQKLIRYFPAAEVYLEELGSRRIDSRQFKLTLFYSVLIELTGIAHVYIAMAALHLEPSFFAAVLSYIVAVIFLIVSPFLRGIGAIEVSMTYILVRFGFTDAAAISITFFYRFLEFWLPFLVGALSFLLKINRLLMRVFPAVLLMVLGVVNIISVLTPAISQRVHFLKNFLPLDAIVVSNYFVLITGLFLLVTSAFMLKGLRMAWYFALLLCMVSMIGNITKAIDYEEATLSLAVMVVLFVSRKEYYIKNSRKLGIIGIRTTLLSCAAVMLYGGIGFYFLDQKHFNIDFSWTESIRYTIQNFLLVGSSDLAPQDAFARDFLYSINLSGLLCISFLVYTLVRPYIIKLTSGAEDLVWAKSQLELYGNSALDYFKIYPDKLIFRPESTHGFIAYRVTSDFAVALENPVAPPGSVQACVEEFDRFCFESGFKSLYYRVSEEALADFPGKKKLFLGQEGVVDLRTFSLEGGARKSMRNGIKKVSEKGYQGKVYPAPIDEDLLQKLKAVSDEWLADTERSEIVFSQGMFLEEELKQQTIITVENQEGKIAAFLNIIPDYVAGEGTFDLIRKTKDAPGGVIDFITIEMFNYFKKQGYSHVNLGFAPLSGIATPQNFPERSMKFAYEKIRSFSHYKGLRDFKEKFSPVWYNKYLIYDQDYDLFKVPAVLAKVIKP